MINLQLMIDLLMHLLVVIMNNYLVDFKILDLLIKMHIFQDGVDLTQNLVYHQDFLKQLEHINLFNNIHNKFVLGFFKNIFF